MKNIKHRIGIFIGSLLAISSAIAFAISSSPVQIASASVSQGSSYVAAFFAPASTFNTGILQSTVLATTTPYGLSGTLGSVIITGANTSPLTIYDATTSDSTKRSPIGGSTATTSLKILASLPASTAAGTYTFDVFYKYGIVVEWTTAANVATSTITYRPS